MRSIRIGRFLSICAVGFCLGSVQADAVDASLELTADQTSISLDGQVQLQVTLNGSRDANPPQLMHVEQFDVQSSGTSSQMQIINGSISSKLIFNFVLTPKSLGNFVVGPARIIVGGKAIDSNSITIQVQKGAIPSASLATEKLPFRVEGEVDTKGPYLNQQFIYTFRFWSRESVESAHLELPEFNGFMKEPLGKQVDSQKVINGIPWHCTEIKFALTPQSAGTLTISPAVLSGEVASAGRHRPNDPFGQFFNDSFFFRGETKPIRLRTEEINVKVRALPEVGKPANFSGLVGKFQIHAALGKTSLAAGDSTTLSITVEGEGNIRDARLPDLDWKNFKTYDDQPTFDTHLVNGKLGGSKTFKKALVPLQPGQLTIPPVALTFFDTTTGSYETVSSQALALEVTPGSGKETLSHFTAQGATGNQNEIKVQGEDLMPIKREVTSRGEPLTNLESWWFFLFDVLLPVSLLLVWLVKKRVDTRYRDGSQRRKHQALRTFQTGIAKLDSNLNFYENSSSLLRGYLGDKLNFEGQALTPGDISRKLPPFGISRPLMTDVENFLKRCERGQYGGDISPGSLGELKVELAEMVKRLERELR